MALIAAAVTVSTLPSTLVSAYEVPDNGVTPGYVFPLDSGLTVDYDVSGATFVWGAVDFDSRGYAASDFTPQVPTTASAPEIHVGGGIDDCPVGTSTTAGAACLNRGTITITFSQPVLNRSCTSPASAANRTS